MGLLKYPISYQDVQTKLKPDSNKLSANEGETSKGFWYPPHHRSVEEWFKHHGMGTDQFERVSRLAKEYKTKIANMLGISVNCQTYTYKNMVMNCNRVVLKYEIHYILCLLLF